VHSRRLVGKWLGEAEAGAQAHPDLPGPPDRAKVRRLALTRIGQPVAVSAGESPATAVEDRCAAATVPAVGDLAPKPRPATAKGARRPHDRDALGQGWPILASPVPRSEHQTTASVLVRTPIPSVGAHIHVRGCAKHCPARRRPSRCQTRTSIATGLGRRSGHQRTSPHRNQLRNQMSCTSRNRGEFR
jgi:hypothetical protein